MLDTWIAGGAGLISLVALVVAVLAWRTAARAARHAGRSADAGEKNVALAEREAEQRAADRNDAAGPRFERVTGRFSERTAVMELRVEGGPGQVVLDVEAAHTPWCSGLSAGAGPVGASIRFPPLERGDTFELTAHLTTVPWDGHRAIVLPLLITAESGEDPPRTWRRRVSVELERPRKVW